MNKKNVSAAERFDSLQMRSQRGTEKYASKKNEDEASEEEHEIEEADLEKKKQDSEIIKGEAQYDEMQHKRDGNW